MRNFADNIVVKALIVLFSVFCIVTIVKLQFDNNEIKHQIGASEDGELSGLKAELEAKEKLVDELQHELDQPFDEEYIIKAAKERLNLREPAEHIFYSDR